MRWKNIPDSNYIISDTGVILYTWGCRKNNPSSIKICGRERGVLKLMEMGFGDTVPVDEVWASIAYEHPRHWVSSHRCVGRAIAQTVHNGYWRCSLRVKDKQCRRFVHRLVLEAFVGPCPKGMEACHKDDNPLNNELGNLKWDTHQANVRNREWNGKNNPSSKYTEEQVIEMRQQAQAGKTLVEISRHFGVPQNYLGKIIRGQAWRHIGGWHRTQQSRSKWDKEKRLGHMPDEELAQLLSVKAKTIQSARVDRGIPSFTPVVEEKQKASGHKDAGITPQNGESIVCKRISSMRGNGSGRKGESHPNARFTEDDIREIRRLADIQPYQLIAEQFGTTAKYVGKIVNREKWKHVV